MKKDIETICFLLLFLISFACSTSKKDVTDKEVVSDPDTLTLDNETADEIIDFDNGQPDADEQQNNLEEGPYGIEFGNTAGDFTLPLETGDWNFA
ncbi:MAG TPA: hypothetical protein PLT70_09395, partial [bacterium]|nr:hypothetical protein [bacterium]